jgi:uncharacterized membrane-anchored protein YhcB (DUF1043 family)
MAMMRDVRQSQQSCEVWQRDMTSKFHGIEASMGTLRESLETSVAQLKEHAEGIREECHERVDSLREELSEHRKEMSALVDRFDALDIEKLKQELRDDIKQQIANEIARALPAAARSAAHAGSTSSASKPPDLGHAREYSATKWVARKVFLRGWCPWKGEAEHGLTKIQCTAVVQKLLSSLPAGMTDCLEDGARQYTCPRFRNSQIILNLRDDAGEECAWELAKACNDSIKNNAMDVRGREIYAAAEQPLWKRMRNSCIARAAVVVRDELEERPDWVVTRAWPDCALMMERGETCIILGVWKDGLRWQWNAANIHRLWPTANVADLDVAFEATQRS